MPANESKLHPGGTPSQPTEFNLADVQFVADANSDEPGDWYGIINFTIAINLNCKWHKYRYSIWISEEEKQAVWCRVTPEPEKPKSPPKTGDQPPEKPPEPEPPEEPPPGGEEPPPEREEPPPEGEKPKKTYGYTKGPPPPPKNGVVDDFCFFSATRSLPTSARIKIVDPLASPAKNIWVEVTFLRWLYGRPPRIVFLRPSRTYGQYRIQDFSFWRPPPPPPPPRQRLRFRISS